MGELETGFMVITTLGVLLVVFGFVIRVIEVRRLGLTALMCVAILWIVHLVYETPFDTTAKVGALALVVFIALCADGFREERPWRKPLPKKVTYPVQAPTTALVEEQVTEGR